MMKRVIPPLMYIVAVFLSSTFFVLLDDLAYFGRIAKYSGFWWHMCSHLQDNQQFVCMATYNVFGILIVLGALIWINYILAGVYGRKIFFIPIFGGIVFLFCKLMLCSIFKITCL